MDKRQAVLQEILRVANEIAPEALTQRLFSQYGSVSLSSVRRAFGSFSEALKTAGLDANDAGASGGREVLDDDALLLELGRVWADLGKRPTEAQFESRAEFSMKPYRKRWGGFARAIDEYVSRFGVPNYAGVIDVGGPRRQTPGKNDPPPKPIVVPETHKPRTSARRERTLYGEPIDFRV